MFGRSNKLILVLMTILCLMVISGTALGSPQPTNYIAVGDSLAAGLTPDYEIGLSYADYIARKLAVEQRMGQFYNFGVPGLTSSDLLKILVGDPYDPPELIQMRADISQISDETLFAYVQKLTGFPDQQVAGIVLNLRSPYPAVVSGTLFALSSQLRSQMISAVAGGEGDNLIITLDIGVNDLAWGVSVEEIGGNIEEILGLLISLDENAAVYMMGYPLSPDFDALNAELQQIALDHSAHVVYVDTTAVFEQHPEKYLPESNFHPNKQGYQALSKAFWSAIKETM